MEIETEWVYKTNGKPFTEIVSFIIPGVRGFWIRMGPQLFIVIDYLLLYVPV
jgi:hypothetical protein